MLTVASPAYLKRHGHRRIRANWKAVAMSASSSATRKPAGLSVGVPQARKKLVLNLGGQLTVNDAGTLYSVCLAGHGMAQVMDLGVEPMLADRRLVKCFPTGPTSGFRSMPCIRRGIICRPRRVRSSTSSSCCCGRPALFDDV